jgi:hypothetical protein
MASPNIVTANAIIGRTTGVVLSNTSALLVLNNGQNSLSAYKINTVTMANRTANTVTASVSWYNSANLQGTEFVIAANIAIPGLSSFTAIDKQTQYYLDENSSLGACTQTASAIVVTASYELIN